MVKIAGDPEEDGPRREIPRDLLALRIVTDDHLSVVNGDDTASPETVMAAAGVLRTLEQDLERIERDMAAALPRLAEEDRAYLNELHQQLAPSREKMLTAQVLARFYNLPEQPDLPGNGGSPARDGSILLHLIGLDLAAWLTARAPGEGKPEPQDGLLDCLWLNLEHDKAAYKLISEGLAARKDKAFIQGSRQEYDDLNRLQRSLFSAYSRLSRVLTAGKDAPVGQAGDRVAATVTDLEASIAEAESAAAALNEAKEQRRDLMDDALRGIRQSRTTAPKLLNYLEKDERDRKRRLRIMGVTTGVLAVAAVVVNLMLMSPAGPAVDLDLEEFSGAMPLKQATAAAELMLAETSSGLWTLWNPAERQEHVQDLVRQAGQKGFISLWLTDETGRPLALWEQGSDPKLF
jgi:hypothetical protein